MSAQQDLNGEGEASYSVKALLGKKNPEWKVYARRLIEITSRKSAKQLLLALSLKETSPQIFREVMKVIEGKIAWCWNWISACCVFRNCAIYSNIFVDRLSFSLRLTKTITHKFETSEENPDPRSGKQLLHSFGAFSSDGGRQLSWFRLSLCSAAQRVAKRTRDRLFFVHWERRSSFPRTQK